MRIGYLVPQFPGQTHVFFWRELQVLEEKGHHVQLFSTRKPPDGLISHDWSQTAMERTIYLGNVDLVSALSAMSKLLPKGLLRWMMQEGKGFSKDVLITLSASLELLRQCKKDGLTHVHVHSCGRAALIAALAHKLGGPTYSVTLHGPLSDYGPGQRFKWSNAAFATVITQKLVSEIERALAGNLPERMVIRPMGVDVDALKRTTPYIPAEHGRPMRIFSCGRLNVVKGHQDLLTAVRQLIDAGVDVRLEIAGEDDAGGSGYRSELEAHMKKLRLQDHAKLLGAIDGDAVKQKLLNAHVFVLASWHEPLGVAYMEAMACGVPVIGTRAGGVMELIEGGENGMLVAPKDPKALADAIRLLAGDRGFAEKLSKNGREHVEQNYRSSLGAETLITEIERLHG